VRAGQTRYVAVARRLLQPGGEQLTAQEPGDAVVDRLPASPKPIRTANGSDAA
jgi:hypothetical protein